MSAESCDTNILVYVYDTSAAEPDRARVITISVDDETYRRARIKAAEQAMSVWALVKRFLTELAAGES